MNPFRQRWMSAGAVLALLLLSACHSADEYTGTYHSDGPKDTCIELNEMGEGVLVRNGEEITFLWEARGRDLRVYTREGGVLTGKFAGPRLTLSMPGEDSIIFIRSE